MKVTPLDIPDLKRIEPAVFADERGTFYELFSVARYRDAGLPTTFVQDNVSRSARGVIRGLHYQLRQPQGKLITALVGSVFDVMVDIRKGSPTFGRWAATELDAREGHQLWVPPGFAHGFCALSDHAAVLYKCTDFYAPDDQCGIAWDDPDLAISWPTEAPILAPRDRGWPRLEDAGDNLFAYQGVP